ncbi:hypothetical protein QN277_014286 [Acacia crassicarpa]|nr:hypothetical protein QN277_014286 [Acacia crassicarpa]
MGKQVLVASLLACSAPVVIPPLVVISVIGISISIPFGLFWASHACTQKLMSKVLPMPATHSHVLKYCVERIGDGKKEDPLSGEHIKQVDESDITDSHKPIPSVVNADETTGLHQESCGLVVNDVADVQNSSRSGPVMSPNNNEVTVNEEKLWKEINAIRVIVGYERTPQASCTDELKKLYIVAGVEPPSLLDASCSSYAIHDHLQFLMSILGVKSHGP